MNTWNKKKNKACGFELAEIASSSSNCNKRHVGASLEFLVGGILKCTIFDCNRHIKNNCECVKGVHDPIVQHAEIGVTKDLKIRSKHARTIIGQELILRVTYQPCLNCAIELVKKGIHKVYFRDVKIEDESGIKYLRKNKVKVFNSWN